MSAMGDTTDELIDLANQVTPGAARARARHAAHLRRAHLDGAARHGDRHPRHGGALLHRVAGRRHHRRRARQCPDHRRHARPDLDRARGWRDPDRGRVPGRLADHQGHHHARPGRLGHHRGGARGRAAARTCARSTPTWTACSPRIPRLVAGARRIPRISYEEMLEMAACGAKVLIPALRRVRAPVRAADPRAVLVQRQDRHLGQRARWERVGGSRHGAGHYLGGRARPQRGQDHRGRRARPGRHRRADLRDHRRGRHQHRHDRAERVGDRHRPHGHLVHAAGRGRAAGAGEAPRRPGDARLPGAALRRQDRQGLGDRRGDALAPGRVAPSSSPPWPRPG